jgi:hypothetical protein
MAKETTDQFKVVVTFASAKDKFLHTMRNYAKQMTIAQTGSDVLFDNYTIRVGFKDDKAKWQDLFHSGEWVTSFTVKNVRKASIANRVGQLSDSPTLLSLFPLRPRTLVY